MPAASTDGDVLVFFRSSDVIAAGDIYSTIGYPRIDVGRGGSVNGVIEGLNRLVDLAISEQFTEGGTRIVPGRGRISDEFDVVEYRDMVTIVRDRVAGDDPEGPVARAGEGGAADAGLGAALRRDDRRVDDRDVRRGGVPEPRAARRGGSRRMSAVARASRRARPWPSLGLASPAAAQFDITGSYNAIFHEDQPERIPGPALGDYAGLPINESARAFAEAWDAVAADRARAPVPGPLVALHHARAAEHADLGRARPGDRAGRGHPHRHQQLPAAAHGLDGRPAASIGQYAGHTWMGFSTGRWEGDVLVVTTTHIKQMWHRRNGIPQSDRVTLTERFILHGTVLTYVTITDDPVYLTEPLVRTTNMLRNPRPLAPQQLLYPVHRRRRDRRSTARRGAALSARREPVPQGVRRRATRLPDAATRGGAATMYPEFQKTLQSR